MMMVDGTRLFKLLVLGMLQRSSKHCGYLYLHPRCCAILGAKSKSAAGDDSEARHLYIYTHTYTYRILWDLLAMPRAFQPLLQLDRVLYRMQNIAELGITESRT